MIKNLKWQKFLAIIGGLLPITLVMPSAAIAAPDAETAYIFNSFSFKTYSSFGPILDLTN